jgi:flagellar basal-body rod modification protein FlgD
MVTSTSSATSGLGSIFQSDTTSQTDKTNKLFTDNSEMYLKLFLTQLQNQDPTQPFDTAQMTEQLSQLNSSQQLIQTNKNLEQLIAQNKSSQASSLSSFINKEIEYLGDTFYTDGTETKQFSYLVDSDYKSVNIEIRDGDDKLVVKYPGDLAQGSHKFEWDGKDASGNPVAAGTYKISAVTEDSDGKFANVSTFIKAKVSGVDFSSSSEPVILVGNNENKIGVDLSRIASVMDIPSTTNTTTN